MTIRSRLALWYTAFLAVMFLVFVPAVYSSQERGIFDEVDRWLAPLAGRIARSATESPRVVENLRTVASGDLNPSQLLNALAAYQDLDLERYSSPGVFVEVLDSSHRVVARSSNLNGQNLPVQEEAFGAAQSAAADGYTADWNGNRVRGFLATITVDRETRGYVLAARSLVEVDRALARMRIWLAAGALAGLGLAAGIGWLLVRNAVLPIEEITATARSIAESRDFGHRLKVNSTRDEVGELASTFNEMLSSLDSAYAAQRRFVSDASHEMRSPLTSIRSNIDILRRALDAPREDREEMLADVASELDRLSRLISDLLQLARADAGHKMEMTEVRLDTLVIDVHRQMLVQAGDRTLELGEMVPVTVSGSIVWLKQLLHILIENALKYTPSGGSIELSLTRADNHVLLKVSDTGFGIAESDLPHIFDRFYRADKARARDEGGAGLGLSIARWIADQHGGDITVESSPGQGTTFTLALPPAD